MDRQSISLSGTSQQFQTEDCSSEILERFYGTESGAPRVVGVSKPRVATPYVVAKMVQFKAENPSIFAWEIRERLLNESICTQDHLPSISSINRILHKISASSTSVKPAFNNRYQTVDFYRNASFNVTVPPFGFPYDNPNDHFLHNSKEIGPINVMQPDDTNEQIIYSDSNFKISFRGRVQEGRTSFTKEQLITLEKEFERTHYPDIFTRKRLSKQIRMDENRIQVWFSNRRAKWRREENARVAKRVHNACTSSSSSSSTKSVDHQPTVMKTKSAYTIKSDILQRYFSSENQKTPCLNCSSSTDDCYDDTRFRSISPPPSYDSSDCNPMRQSPYLPPTSTQSTTYWSQYQE